ncbi:hypothetical protein [Paracoccus sp. (in: a-proteobacteria)]|uniref:hypothetical protein n=1 Tax=Paracoccus sp. TaxID=267 RepID=UPI002898D0C0|nr:hypothetical protein [Paracoccus sp. (in: a-proteobacteria)]
MKLKMLTGLSGPDYNLAPGDEREFPQPEAIRLIEAGFAVAVDAEPETATKKRAPEKRAKA